LHFKIVIKPKKTKKREIRRYKMNTLNLGSDEIPATKKKSNTRNLKIALGLAAVILVPTIGSTLAGTITIGTLNTLEFAQGVTATTACDSSIVITPGSTLSGGSFKLTTLTLSGVNNATGGGCAGKYLTLKVLNSADPIALVTINDGASSGVVTQVKFRMPETCTDLDVITDSPNTDATVTLLECDATAGGATVTLVTAVETTNVNKITLESSST
jgi:hypothetical protein